VEYLIKDLISKHIIDTIDKEIERLKDERVDQGLEELSDSEIIFAKMNKVETFTDDKADDPKAKRFGFIAKSLMDRISDLRAEIDPSTFDQLKRPGKPEKSWIWKYPQPGLQHRHQFYYIHSRYLKMGTSTSRTSKRPGTAYPGVRGYGCRQSARRTVPDSDALLRQRPAYRRSQGLRCTD